jgi:putative ABC transport system permease protein
MSLTTRLALPWRAGRRIPPLAWRNVERGGARARAANAGVGFVVTMVLLQLGFLEAVRATATSLYDQLEFDVALVSPRYDQLYDAGTLPLERLQQAEGLETVVDARPIYVSFAMWRCPPLPLEPEHTRRGQSPPDRGDTRVPPGAGSPRPVQRRELLAIGIDLEKNPFREPIRSRVDAARAQLELDGRVLLNEQSHPDFGWWAWPAFDGWELGRSAAEVVGGFPLERGFGADGAVLVSDLTFERRCTSRWARGMSLGLVRVRPGADGQTVRRLKEILPPDTVALARGALNDREQEFWVNQTSTGRIFAAGVLVSMLVAAVVVYQVLSNDVRTHLPEYATLKAMGYTNRYLSRVVVVQALFYALGAFGPAVVVAYVAYRITAALASIPMRMTLSNLALALGLAVAVSLLSALLTVGKLRTADPAELY